MVVTALLPSLAFLYLTFTAVAQTPARVAQAATPHPCRALPSFALTPVPGQPQDVCRLLASQVFPHSHARRLFPHRRHKHSRTARHTTQVSQVAFTNPTSSPTHCRRRTSLVASHLGRRHSQCLPSAHTRPRERSTRKHVHLQLFQRHGPHRQLPYTWLACKRQPEALKGRAAKARPICPQALLTQQPPQLFQQLPHISSSPKHIRSRELAASTSGRFFQASLFWSHHHTTDAPAHQVRQLVQAQEQHVHVQW